MASKSSKVQSESVSRLKDEAQRAIADFDKQFALIMFKWLPSCLAAAFLITAFVAYKYSTSTANYVTAGLLVLLVLAGIFPVRRAYRGLDKTLSKHPSIARATPRRLDAVDFVVALGFVVAGLSQHEGSWWSSLIANLLFVGTLGAMSVGLTTYVAVNAMAVNGKTGVKSKRGVALVTTTRASAVLAILLAALSVVDAFKGTRGKTWLAVALAFCAFAACFIVESRRKK